MKIQKLLPQHHSLLSIEIFPPKTARGHERLKSKLSQYLEYEPDFISVTYGAGGEGSRESLSLADHIQNELQTTAMSHITCGNHTEEELVTILQTLRTKNIHNLMVLRGDKKTPNSPFTYATDFIRLIQKHNQDNFFSLGAAAYPEGHIESPSTSQDLDIVKQKIDLGVSFFVTQFFLDNDHFRHFRDQFRKNNIRIPVLVGILPISNYSQITKFSLMCGCTIPAKVMKGLYGRSDEDQVKFGLDHALKQVEELLRERVDGIHLYALNKKKTVEVLAPIVRQYNAHNSL